MGTAREAYYSVYKKMYMKIALVLHPYGEKKPSGLGRAIYALIKHIIEEDGKNTYVVYVKGKEHKRPSIQGKNWTYQEVSGGHLWLDRIVRGFSPADLYVFFTPIMPFLFQPNKAIVVAHDFGYARLPAVTVFSAIKNRVLFFLNRRACRNATKVIAVSEFTKREIQDLFGVSKEKIIVVYNGYDSLCKMTGEITDDSRKHTFLFVGVLKARKNIERVIRAFACFVKDDTQAFRLVVVGGGNEEYIAYLSQLTCTLGIQGKVDFLGYVSDAELARLYRTSYALIFPSLLEGFGLSVVQAMQCGIPTIVSRGTALEEITNGASLLVDPLDVMDIARGMTQLVHDRRLWKVYEEKGRLRSKNFSWEKAGVEYCSIMKKLQ